MNFQLYNKVALVTGASKGIGFSIAAKLADYGCNVILLSRNRRNLNIALSGLKKNAEQKHYILQADLSETDEVINKVSRLLRSLDRIDIFINNSSGPMPKSFRKYSKNDYLDYFNQVFLSANEIFKICYPFMKKNNFGRIINITGTSSLEPIESLSMSSLKSIFLTWSKAIAKEVGKNNITINNILPGPTKTNELNKIINKLCRKNEIDKDQYINNVLDSMAIPRIAEPEEIANLVLFLVSEYASFITGNNIKIDGGFSKGI